jgi:NAD(P)-dependent dehydrogenase (short-subunit alcohol dehydrogenase family)
MTSSEMNSATAIRPFIPRPDLLDGKVAIITGASRGIGATAARIFARAGAAVVLAARGEDALDAVAREIKAGGGQALAVPTDVSDPASIERLVRHTLTAYARVDAAFNNAGGGSMPVPMADLAVEDFDRVVEVNLRGVFLSMKYEIPAMIDAGGGSIVNMSSTVGVQGWKGIGAYVASKHGVIGLTKSGALDYAEHGIRINAVAPGSIVTDRVGALSDEQRAPIIQAVPMRRIGSPEEVSATVAWLCSDEAAFITGAVIPVDGGQLARV